MSPSEILKMGQKLAGHPALEKQKALIVDYLSANFEGQAFLQLDKAFLPLDDTRYPLNSPFDSAELARVETAREGQFHWLAAPMTHGEITLGALLIQRATPFTSQERSKIGTIATLVGTSLFATLQSIQRNGNRNSLPWCNPSVRRFPISMTWIP